MDLSKKNNAILYTLICCLLVFQFSPVSAYDNEPYTVDPVTSFFSPGLLSGQNYTWVVQEWYQMEDWLNPNTPYEPKSGDKWTMTIVGDLSEITPTLTALELFGVHYDPQTLTQLSNYLQFNISGYTFEEVFGSPVGADVNWVILSKFFLIPDTIKDASGKFRNFSTYYNIFLEAYHPDTDFNDENGLKISATLSDGSYTADVGIEFDAELDVLNNFTYIKKSVVSGLITGKVQLIIEQSEFDTNQTDTTSDDTSNDSDIIGAPFEISGYPSLMLWSIVGIIFLFKLKDR